jgi:hypothetical protein
VTEKVSSATDLVNSATEKVSSMTQKVFSVPHTADLPWKRYFPRRKRLSP